jgi:hypothetical protein
MSALGQKQTCAAQKAMSALPPKADICSAQAHVRFVPTADIACKKKETCVSLLTGVSHDQRNYPHERHSHRRPKARQVGGDLDN